MEDQDRYANVIFLYAVLPLLKVIVESDVQLSGKFQGKTAIFQVSALDSTGKKGMHFEVNEGQWTVHKSIVEKADVELEFQSVPLLNGFFKGTSKKLPKIKGIHKLGLLIPFMRALLKMAKLLGYKTPPEDEAIKRLLVKLYFYLLSSGISQLNKAGHPEIATWVKRSPDRVYAWTVNGDEDMSAYLRIKAGNSKASRGLYKRSKPFFTMRFDSTDSALGILMEIDDMIDSTVKGKLVMEGAPEFGAQLGIYMGIVGSYAK